MKYIFVKYYSNKGGLQMIFEKPVIKEIVDENAVNPNNGRETCDTYDWSGCCYNG